ncbi:MAG TPA: amino acid adenylation domain-containing protein, partial [Thermoanaerobaculia bacterium]|nr:amino acid adenylation domain-containing protein [Thermoanaerobaculia bacterium]
HPDHLAYVIYTSGSTGRPKGAMNAHRGVVNRLAWMQAEYGLTADDVVLQKTPFSFDVSVWEFFWPLLTGARLVVARPEGHKDPGYLAGVIREQGITTLHFVPSMLAVFLEAPGIESCLSLRRVMASGEALPAASVRRFQERLGPVGAVLHNLYGPTEAAVDVTAFPLHPGYDALTVPIGWPIANVRMHLLDREMRPVPPGVQGELYIGGVALARGYHRRPALTAEKFVPDPFGASFGAAGARLYRTGDVARLREDGAIEYLGRTDDQVKIRGVRIELQEIEAVLRRHSNVGEAVVVARREEPGGPRLVAYVVLAAGAAFDVDGARAFLARSLPEAMVPADFVTLEAMPLSPNGKVDRKALPAPERRAGGSKTAATPRTELEETIAGVWREVLQVERVGVFDNFFDLGGHSLLLAQALAALQGRLGLEITMVELFQHPTIAALAEHLGAKASARRAAPAGPSRTQQARDRAARRQEAARQAGPEGRRRR